MVMSESATAEPVTCAERARIGSRETFCSVVKPKFRSTLKRLFNDSPRIKAGLTPGFCASLANTKPVRHALVPQGSKGRAG